MIYFITKLSLVSIVIILIFSGLLTACSLEGDIGALRQKPGENPGEPISTPDQSIPAPGTPTVIASDGILTVKWTFVEEALQYEVYISTAEVPPASPVKTVAVTTTVLDGLFNKTIYYVWVKAVNENGASDFSPRARGIPWPINEVPATPERPVIISGINQLTVNWEDCGGASSYEVYVNTTPSAPSESAVTTEKTNAVINYLGDGNILENGVIYYIWVRAVNNTGKSSYSPVEAGTPRIPTVVPAAPSRPVLIVGSRELSVSWQAVELTSAYEVWFGTSSDSSLAQKYGGDISGGITETFITGLVNETTYYVWIKAKNVVGTSDFSLSASAKPSAFAVLPETPDMPTIISGNRELTISWTAVEGALFYEVWMGTTSNSAYAEKYGVDISGTSITLTGLTNGATYYIWIKTKNNIGISEFSQIASGIPSASDGPPLAPQSAPVVTSGNGGLTLSWQAEEGASAYELWAGTTPNPTTAVKQGNDVSALSGTITGLTNETTYYIWIKAKNSKGTSGFSPMASGTPNITPGLYRGAEKIGNHNLSTALSYISSNAVSGDDFYIVLGANESASPTSLNYSGKTVGITLLGYGGERTITLASNGYMFLVYAGVSLTLDENITLVGLNTNNASLIYVASGSTLIINEGAKINGNNGGGIRNFGTFIMNGGIISGNYLGYMNIGGGISVEGGTFTMNGGMICGNTAGWGGGISILTNGNGTFTMNGGIINENTAIRGGGGIYGTFTMNGGTISGNTASENGGGIYVTPGTVTINNGEISGNIANSGGGICVNVNSGIITMNGGTISGNVANDGGGIVVSDGTVTMNGGTISGNTANGGGGVKIYNTTFTMHGGTISGNSSGNNGGGGVYNASGAFKKLPSGDGQNSGIIYGNEETGVDANGAPLKNTANNYGHTVYSSSGRRNTTAGQTDHIDTTTGRGLSASGNPPYGQ